MDLGSMAIGVGKGLALAASGRTVTKISAWVEAKIASIEAGTAHTKTVAASVAATAATAVAPAPAPVAAPVVAAAAAAA